MTPAGFSVRIVFAILGLVLEHWMATRAKRKQRLIGAMLVFAVPVGFFAWGVLEALWNGAPVGALAPLLLAAPFIGLELILLHALRMPRDVVIEIEENGFAIGTFLSRHFEPWAKVSPFTVLGDLEIRYEMLGGGDGFVDRVRAQRAIPNTAADEGQLPALCATLNDAREKAWMNKV